ncbi:carboxylesterase family protein [Streptomyces caniscabiei]|uniref:carboxylesterase family protein n=1 Tax=Streptomyces caniscabiei TaxID=2746961 RepID=UPI001F2C90FB|nr:carboxylesterase family protein [Streptomyces caniscabiei]
MPGSDFPIGSPHASDINLKFTDTDTNVDSVLGVDQSPERLATARHMSELWAGFAHTGRPTVADVPRWPAYTPTDRATMWLDASCRIVTDPDRDERLLWENRD